MKVKPQHAIWHVPLLVLAGVTALAAIGLAVLAWRHAVAPAIAVPAIWGLAGASLTFTIARVIHATRVTRRELELIVLGGAALAIQLSPPAGLVAAVGAISLLLDGER
ncbi:MAG: hypothetical protein KC464_28830 [Myxococcales bacterium]|nr:hypothetical protein [Myxococcales bacterium]